MNDAPRGISPELQMRANFGEAMRQARLAREVKKEELAEALDVDVKTISRMEDGSTEPRLFTALRVARFLELTIEEMVGQPADDFEVTRTRELRRAFRLMSDLLRSSMTELDMRDLVPNTIRDERVRAAFAGVFEEWYPGTQLGDLLQKYPEIFDPVTVALVQTARTGTRPLYEVMDDVASRLAES